MFGGSSSNPKNPLFPGEGQFQYDNNAFPQLQLFGDYTTNMEAKAFKDPEPMPRQQKHISQSNKLHQNEVGQGGSILNPNLVSTGLKLSYEEDEHNSTISSPGEGMATTVPIVLPPNNSVKVEIDCQKQELEEYVRTQEENMLKGIRDLHHKQTTAFLTIVEKGLSTRLHEKDLIIENMNRKNRFLEDRIKQVTSDAQSWQYRAKYNESMLGVLKNNLQQVVAQNGKEGSGDSEVDDSASCSNPNHSNMRVCRACKVKEVSVLVLPCRHLCLCTNCERFVCVCPVCQVMKTASVEVYMS